MSTGTIAEKTAQTIANAYYPNGVGWIKQEIQAAIDEATIELQAERDKYETTIYQFIASLTFCDHLGDVCNEIDTMLGRIGSDIRSEDWCDLWELSGLLGKRGITTLYGTSLGDDDEEKEEN